MNLNRFVEERFSALMLAGLVLLCAFVVFFFFLASAPNYWHSGELGTYLTHSFFVIEKGFFVEIPYWHHGYGLLSSLYQPLFFLLNSALFSLSSFLGFSSIYWTYFATLLLSYVFAFALTWKISKKNLPVYLLTVGNFFALGLLVINASVTKIFAFNLCFPAIVYLLDRRNCLRMTRREIAAFSLLMAAVFASHIYIFFFFCLLYLGVLGQNRKIWLRGLVPLAMVPIMTLPYLVHFIPFLLNAAAFTPILAAPLGLAPNFYMATFVLFLLLCLVVREWCLIPLAGLATMAALNLNLAIPVFSGVTLHCSTLLLLAVIFYYLWNYDFSKRFKLLRGLAGRPSKQAALLLLLFALLVLNFFYFAPRIENANLFNNPDFGPLLEYGELESVFFLADLEGGDAYLNIYLPFQTFNFHNYSVNSWFPLGDSHLKFSLDREKIVTALKQSDCQLLDSMIKKMGLKTLVIKNLPEDFSCSIPVDAELGAFKILKP